MAEKRKPDVIFLLRNQGKKNQKVELFDANLFGMRNTGREQIKRYRIRINGKWFDKRKDYEGLTYFTKWEFRDLFWRSIKF